MPRNLRRFAGRRKLRLQSRRFGRHDPRPKLQVRLQRWSKSELVHGDFNGDGKVDGSDVTILAGNWQAGVNAAETAVPEPSMIVLLLGVPHRNACRSAT